MSTIDSILFSRSTAESRWARLGPYYAMFPLDFAFETVKKFSKENDYIIDPFAGRFSSIFAGSVIGRKGVGIEINSVGWLYDKTKLHPGPSFRCWKGWNLFTKKDTVIKKLWKIYLCFLKCVFAMMY